ncbi:hypothetical protein Trydic_g10768 [Trypoxylus dichotomus]
MKFVIALVVVFTAAYSTPARKLSIDLKEEDPFRIRYLPREDQNGNIYYEDLLKSYQNAPATRASTSNVKIYLYTPINVNDASILPSDDSTHLFETNFDSSLPIFFIIHGWNNNYKSAVCINVRNAILSITKANVFVVDWSDITNGLYAYSVINVNTVGEIVSDYIYSIMNTYGLPASQFRLVGHSLGAHVSGCVGSHIKSLSGSLIASIVALDPAAPLFSINNLDNRVDPSDASYVHVIHTNAGFLGFTSALGHSDYYPNGGSRQPGCGLDIVGICAHSRSHEYYAESILSSRFVSSKCDSYSNYDKGDCSHNRQSLMGQLYIDTSASGEYYLTTNNQAPYARG